MPAAKTWTAVVERWLLDGVRSRAPASTAELDRFEARCGVSLPADIASYFRVVGGMREDEMEREMIRFWPLSEVSPASEHVDGADPDLFVFADWSLWCHGYAFRASGAGDVWLVDGGTPSRVSDDFLGFWDAYLHDPMRLFPR
ncbi:MAG: SMI1/KNR4 family protein [Sandaracinus sp.]|nr:SMI1/KNR4 family protein [Sandaracinus sp.]